MIIIGVDGLRIINVIAAIMMPVLLDETDLPRLWAIGGGHAVSTRKKRPLTWVSGRGLADWSGERVK